MAERQLKPAETVYPCAYCQRPFADRSNRRRHIIRTHAGAVARNLVVTQRPPSSSTSSGTSLTLRHAVAAITEDVLRSNFTRPSEELLSTIRMLAPSLSLREAEVLLAASSAAVKHTSGLFQTLNSLRQAGGPATAAERDLTRQLAYLSVGPRWPHPTLDDSGSVASLPMAVAPGQLVESWLASNPAASGSQNDGFATEGGVVLPELTEGGALSPPPPPPSSAAVAPPGRVVEGRRQSPEDGGDRYSPPASRAAPAPAPPGRVVESRRRERSGSGDRRRPPQDGGDRYTPPAAHAAPAPPGRIAGSRRRDRSRSGDRRRSPQDGRDRYSPSALRAAHAPPVVECRRRDQSRPGDRRRPPDDGADRRGRRHL